jgi:hypothetical protein
MAVLLMTAPSGARLPRGNVTVLVRPRSRAKAGGRMTEIGIHAIQVEQPLPQHGTTLGARPRFERVSESIARRREGVELSNPRSRRCSITSGTPPARNARTVGWWVGPLGMTLTRRGVRRLMAIQSSTVGRRRPAAWAMAGMCKSRFGRPAEGRMHGHGVAHCGVGQDSPRGQARRLAGHQRTRRVAGQLHPDRLATRGQRRMRQR